MPSIHQQASRLGYDPSEYADADHEDPARFLECGELLAIARIRGIHDHDLLDAYLDVEIERDRRQNVVAAINQRTVALRGDND